MRSGRLIAARRGPICTPGYEGLQLDKASTQAKTGDSGHYSVASAARDRRRVKGLALASAILFLLPVLYALGRSEPEHFTSQGNYALLASAANAGGGEDVRIPADDVTPAAPVPVPEQAAPAKSAAQPSPAPAKHDKYYCDFYAQAVTGNVTPEQASRRQQTSGAVMGAVSGAVLGALFGGSGGHAGRSSVLGASAGLLAGATMGSGYAQRAADDIRSRYDAAFSSCMTQGDDTAR